MSAKITVVTPSYNQARFLGQTLRSVLAQRSDIHEYLVLDGGSTDGSADLIARYAEQGGGITYWHSRKDAGQASAINEGFRRATGDVLYWVNSDDIVLPGAFRRVREALDAHPEWDAVTGYHVRIDAESRVISVHRIPGEGPSAARWGVHHQCQPTTFLRRRTLDQVGLLDESLHCVLDTDLWLRIFDAGLAWGHIPAYQAAFRVHDAAKGSAWLKEYAAESSQLDTRYSRYHAGTPKHKLGLLAYRAAQVLSGRQLRASVDARKWRGRRIDEVFPDVFAPVAAAAATNA